MSNVEALSLSFGEISSFRTNVPLFYNLGQKIGKKVAFPWFFC
jgi:hypothetical protein